jgi:hypothetical protein
MSNAVCRVVNRSARNNNSSLPVPVFTVQYEEWW